MWAVRIPASARESSARVFNVLAEPDEVVGVE